MKDFKKSMNRCRAGEKTCNKVTFIGGIVMLLGFAGSTIFGIRQDKLEREQQRTNINKSNE